MVDDEDFDTLSKYKWHLDTSGYPVYHKYKDRKDKSKKYEVLRIHNIVKNVPKTHVLDHIDRNKLNNQKSNLRESTRSQNSMNRDVSANYLGIRGVYRNHGKNFKVCVGYKNKSLFIGLFKTLEDARLAYAVAAKELHGEFVPEYII